MSWFSSKRGNAGANHSGFDIAAQSRRMRQSIVEMSRSTVVIDIHCERIGAEEWDALMSDDECDFD